MTRIKFWSLILLLPIVSGCKKETVKTDEQSFLNIEIHSALNGIPLKENTALSFDNSYDMKIDELKFFISNPALINDEGDTVWAKFAAYPESVFLFHLKESKNFLVNVPEGTYQTLIFDVGLNPELNDMNPGKFDYPHPLSWEHDMFWDMLKYRFFILESAVNYPDTSDFTHVISYHLGGDDYLRKVALPVSLNIQPGTSELDIEFNLDDIFKEIDWTTFFSFHSEGIQTEIGLKMMDNVGKSFR